MRAMISKLQVNIITLTVILKAVCGAAAGGSALQYWTLSQIVLPAHDKLCCPCGMSFKSALLIYLLYINIYI